MSQSLSPDLAEALRHWAEAIRQDSSHGVDFEALRSRIERISTASLDRIPYEEEKKMLREKLGRQNLPPTPQPMKIRGLKNRDLADLRKIEANLKRFCEHLADIS